MDENKLTPAPEEVVLTYDPGKIEEVVLTYSAPLPPAMCPAEEAGEEIRLRRRRRRKTVILIALAALLLIAAGVTGYLVWRSTQVRHDRPGGKNEEMTYETAIPTYPTGGDFRLSVTEARTEVLTAQQIYERVNPSVVSVVSTQPNGQASMGTGVILSADGYLITNYHVVEGGVSCGVLLSTGAVYEALLVGYDEENDLAVLKVEHTDLPAAVFGSSDLLTVGDKVYAIGNPLGLELRGTLTDGIVSAINRDVEVQGTTMTLIQTNAALNSGNSGGPLINEYGQVVGINTIKMVSSYADDAIEGLGFAIPGSTVAHIANCLIATGEVTPEPMLGISVRLQAYLDGEISGLVVDSVTEGLGGEKAGVLPGDIIVAADGEPLVTSNDLLRCRRRYALGEELPLTIFRAGEFIEVRVPLMAAPEE